VAKGEDGRAAHPGDPGRAQRRVGRRRHRGRRGPEQRSCQRHHAPRDARDSKARSPGPPRCAGALRSPARCCAEVRNDAAQVLVGATPADRRDRAPRRRGTIRSRCRPRRSACPSPRPALANPISKCSKRRRTGATGSDRERTGAIFSE